MGFVLKKQFAGTISFQDLFEVVIVGKLFFWTYCIRPLRPETFIPGRKIPPSPLVTRDRSGAEVGNSRARGAEKVPGPAALAIPPLGNFPGLRRRENPAALGISRVCGAAKIPGPAALKDLPGLRRWDIFRACGAKNLSGTAALKGFPALRC